MNIQTAVLILFALLPGSNTPSRAAGMMIVAEDESCDRAKALYDAACEGDEAAARAALSRGIDFESGCGAKYAKKALKCALKKGHPRIGESIERAQGGERILSVEEESAQAASLAAEKAADEAAKAGERETALARYRDALKSAGALPALEARLREKAIRYALALTPPPGVPEEARSCANRGSIYVKKAENDADLRAGIAELEAATRLAPWWPDAYFNLGLLREKLKEYDAAAASLRFYLLAAPAAADRAAVQRKLDELAVEKEMAERRAKEADEAAAEGETKPAMKPRRSK